MRSRITARLLVMALALVALAAPGCIFSPDSGGDPNPTQNDYVFASTVDKLMDNFKLAYARLDPAKYRDMLDTRFQFYYSTGEDPHDYTTEVRIAENMFSGNPPTNPDPNSTNDGIRSVEVDKLLPLEPWQNISASHPDFGGIVGAKRGYFDVKFIFHHDAGTITVASTQFFYAVPVQTVVDGEARTEWKLLGQEDIAGR